jgi:hypothetical protein
MRLHNGTADGLSPAGGLLILDAEGNLYGATYGSRGGFGAVFEYALREGFWTETTLHNFSGDLSIFRTRHVRGSSPLVGSIRSIIYQLFHRTLNSL